MEKKIAIAGAGITGAIIAQRLATGPGVTVIAQQQAEKDPFVLNDENIDQVLQSITADPREVKPTKTREPGRNDPCPCGSGKKYKKCHLAALKTSDQLDMIEAREKYNSDPRNQK